MEKNIEKRTALIYRIKKIHQMYKKSNNEQKERLFTAAEFIVNELIGLGYQRDLLESLIMFGEEFLLLDSVVNSEHYRRMFPEAFEVFGV